MPAIARKAGLYFGKLNRFFNKVKSDINEELRMDELKDEMSMDEEKIIVSEVTEVFQSSADSLKEENIFSDKKHVVLCSSLNAVSEIRLNHVLRYVSLNIVQT